MDIFWVLLKLNRVQKILEKCARQEKAVTTIKTLTEYTIRSSPTIAPTIADFKN